MASTARGQDEPNCVLWLATQADKMEPSHPLGTVRCILQAKCPLIINPFLTKFVWSRWLDIGLILLWVYGPRESRYALTSRQYDPGLIPPWCRMWVEFAVSSCLATRVSRQVLQFSSLQKTNVSKFQFGQDRGPTWKPAEADVASSLNIVI